jgi:uncharacterized protein with PQ loop repeat
MIFAASTVTRTFGIIAPTLTIFQCLAQANRIRTTGAKGVSLATWIMSAFVSQVWFCYGIIFHVTAEVVANIPAIAVSLVVAFLAARSQEKMARSVMGYLAATVVTILATYAGSFHDLRWVLSSVAAGSAIIIYLPQLALVIRPKDLSGVSIVSWLPRERSPHCRLVRLRLSSSINRRSPYRASSCSPSAFIGVHPGTRATDSRNNSRDGTPGTARRVGLSALAVGSAARTRVHASGQRPWLFSRAVG